MSIGAAILFHCDYVLARAHRNILDTVRPLWPSCRRRMPVYY